MFRRWKEEKPEKGRKSKESVLGKAVYASFEGEEAPGDAAGGRAQRSGGDVERNAIGAAEGATGDIAGGHFDDAVDGASGSDADDTSAAPAAVPQEAFAVHRGTV